MFRMFILLILILSVVSSAPAADVYLKMDIEVLCQKNKALVMILERNQGPWPRFDNGSKIPNKFFYTFLIELVRRDLISGDWKYWKSQLENEKAQLELIVNTYSAERR